MIVWGVISAATASINTYGGLLAVRFFLGFVEAAFFVRAHRRTSAATFGRYYPSLFFNPRRALTLEHVSSARLLVLSFVLVCPV